MNKIRKRHIRKIYLGVILLGFLMFLYKTSCQAAIYPAKYQAPDKTSQLAVVDYQGSSKGIFRYYERKNDGWKMIFKCKAWVGQRGIGKKKEGDKKTPTGMYILGQAFGILKNPGTKMPYVKVNQYHYWCGDSNSVYYNQLIRADQVKHICHGEQLIRYSGVYDYAISIGYNKKGTPKKGSAIFLHCSRNRATAGCVAIPKKKMKRLLKRLNPECHPRIIVY